MKKSKQLHLILNSILIVIAGLAIVAGFFVAISISQKLLLWGLSLGCIGNVLFSTKKYRIAFAVLAAILFVVAFIMSMSNR